jgi:site-specific recombinase XerD
MYSSDYYRTAIQITELFMASLIKQSGWYYLQFYDSNRDPIKKRVTLKTRTKRTAEKLKRKLEDDYATGDYDPWTGYHASNTDLAIDENATIKEALDYFIERKSKEDWRENTIINNTYILNAFIRYVGEEKSVKALTDEKVNEYLNQERFAYETKKSHKARVMGFLNWLSDNKVVSRDFSSVKIYNNDDEQDQTISYVSPKEIETIKKTIRKKVKTDIEQGIQSRKRNAGWLIDFIDWQRYSGMRISESLNLYPNDINTNTWEIKIGSDTFSTKVKSKQILPIGEVEVLKDIAKRRLKQVSSDERLFEHKDRRRTSRTFKKYVRLALPEREDITMHTLRHTCCIELLRKGVSIYTVQRWMRHSSVKTTQKYADLLGIDISTAVGEAFSNS